MEKGVKIESSLVPSKHGVVRIDVDDNQQSADILIPPRENIGRWDESEHKLFLEGLEKYGNDWKQIANMISTRNLVQVRTHAQKYFQKINKNTCTKNVSSDYRKKKDPVKHTVKEVSPQSSSTILSPISVPLPEPSLPLLPTKIDLNVPAKESRKEHTVYFNPANLTPRSLYPQESMYLDYDFLTESYRSSFNSMFDFECNNSLDDLEFFDYTELKTPVFD